MELIYYERLKECAPSRAAYIEDGAQHTFYYHMASEYALRNHIEDCKWLKKYNNLDNLLKLVTMDALSYLQFCDIPRSKEDEQYALDIIAINIESFFMSQNIIK